MAFTGLSSIRKCSLERTYNQIASQAGWRGVIHGTMNRNIFYIIGVIVVVVIVLKVLGLF